MAITYLGVGVSYARWQNKEISGLKFGLDATFSFVGLRLRLPGLIVSSVYFIIDQFVDIDSVLSQINNERKACYGTKVLSDIELWKNNHCIDYRFSGI